VVRRRLFAGESLTVRPPIDSSRVRHYCAGSSKTKSVLPSGTIREAPVE
jgi:hypothetical protein